MPPEPLRLVSAAELMVAMLPRRIWFIKGLLTAGVTLLVGDPKIGKSWLILQILHHLSTGASLWGFATARTDVLYLALEDILPRLQQRFWRIADEASEGFRIALAAGTLDAGLIDQLEGHLAAYPATGVVAIDTLRLVRGSSASSPSVYAVEYADVHRLKELADDHGIAVIPVHHARKAQDADVFKVVSGSQGLMGAADQTMVLRRDGRADAAATLSITGRDVECSELRLRFEDCRGTLVERLVEKELAERSVPDDIRDVIDFAELGAWNALHDGTWVGGSRSGVRTHGDAWLESRPSALRRATYGWEPGGTPAGGNLVVGELGRSIRLVDSVHAALLAASGGGRAAA